MPLPIPSKYCLILLNLPIIKTQDLKDILSGVECFICSDGGLNRLRDYDMNVATVEKCPQYVIGDMDSIEESSLDWLCKKFGKDCTSFVKLDDQDTTDFEKALKFATETLHYEYIVAMNCFSGRLDHTLSSLNVLNNYPMLRIILINESCLAELVKAKEFHFTPQTDSTCGILPLFGPIKIKTTGLMWDINGELRFGGLISTSNKMFEAKPVCIDNSSPFPYIWTVGFEK